MLSLEGYLVLEQIYESDHSQVFRGRRQGDDRPVIIKIPTAQRFSVRENLRYRNEYNLLAALDLSRIIRVYELARYRAGYAIVEEDYGACDLDQWLSGRSLSVAEFLPVAIQMAEGLAQLHGQQVIHKDLNPANVLIHRETGVVKLTDFGLSTLIRVETPEVCVPELIEGNLTYISPEQTGRMNRVLDYRTDLYSLGACYYRMLTGAPPFVTEDALELLHCHIARPPLPPLALHPELPPGLSELVLKLLEKRAEDRYQSASGVQCDLEAWLASAGVGSARPLELGRRDVSSQFQVASKLYGRAAETTQLLDAFDRAAGGRSELLLVAGYSGIGKTSLVNEVQKSLVRQRGYFIAGKYDQFQRDQPFSALIQAFRRLIQQLLTEPEARIQHWRQALADALGANARVIGDVIPEVEWITGPLPPVPELGPTEAQNRFTRSFQQFIGVFARPEHPLVVFVDDLQWADGPSLGLIEVLCADPSIHGLLMIGAYRDNEVSAAHPLMLSLQRLRETGVRLQTVTLGPLALDDLNQLVADTLHRPPAATEAVARLLLEKTGGNPFFVGQFLRELHARGLFRLDPAQQGWQWDLARIEAAGLTDNVVDLMVGKLGRLGPATQQVLRLAACLGNRFALETLATIDGRSAEALSGELWEAIREGLILTGESEFRFLHDRVQQAAYSLIGPEALGPLHLHIGRQLWRHAEAAGLEGRLFDITGHLNAALALLDDPDERLRLSELNLQAGRKAKASTAYEAASRHFQAAIDLLPADAWGAHYRHTLEAYRERADAAYLLARFEAAEADLDAALAHAQDRYDQADIHLQKIVQYNQLGRYNALVEVARAALGLFGAELPDPDDAVTLQVRLTQQLEDYSRLLHGRPISDLLQLDDVADREQDQIIRLFAILTDGTYIAIPSLFPCIVMEVVNRSMRHGHNAMSAIGFAWATVVVVQQFRNYEDAYALGELAMRLNERYPNPRIRAQVTFLYAVCALHWVRPLTEQLAVYQQAYQYGIENGNLVFAGYARTMIPKTTLAAATVDKALEECAVSLAFYAPTGSPFLVSEQFCQLFLQRLKGQGEGGDPTSLSAPNLDEQAWLAHWQQPATRFGHGLAYFLNFKLQLLYLFGDWRSAWLFANAHAEWMQYIPILYETTVFTFYRALAGATIHPEADAAEQATIVATLDAAIADFAQWASLCPNNFAWQEHLLRAEAARLKSQPEDALQGYEQAAGLARHYHAPQGVALSRERTGRLHLERDDRASARPLLEESVFQYFQWGATGKAQALNQEFARLLTDARPPSSRPSSPQVTTAISSHKLDLDSVLKAALALSSEIQLERLLQKLIGIVIENAGADRGYVLLPGSEDWRIVARAGMHHGEALLEEMPLAAATEVCATLIRYVIRTGQPLLLDDARQDPVFGRDPDVTRRAVHSVLCLPLLAQSRLCGVLYLENDLLAGAFAPERVQILRMLSAQAAISIENARLYGDLEQQVAERTRELSEANRQLQRLSECDGLTGIANRRKFDATWSQEWKRATRQGLSLAVVLLDVDHFKAFNDHYGHQAGDDCLRQVAEAVAAVARRPEDLAARFGGEEFVVVLPGLTAPQALRVAENLRAAVAACRIPHAHNSAAAVVTASLGVAAAQPGPGNRPEQLLAAADAALYQAKHEGRNRIVLAVAIPPTDLGEMVGENGVSTELR